VFLRRFIALAHQEGFDYNLIEAFDQIWKYQNEGIVGANWGLWSADRQPKFPLFGPLIENPAWPNTVAVSLLFGILILMPPLWANLSLPPGAQLRLALLAIALGDALGFAWSATTPDLYDIHLRIAAIGNLGAQAILASLLTRRAADRFAGRPTTWRNAAQTTEAIRTLRPPTTISDLCPDLSFVFAWTAAILELLLVFDPRYRDFPLPSFAVPALGVIARALLRDMPSYNGARGEPYVGELCVGLTLVAGSIASAVIEGPANHQSLIWNATALILAFPLLLTCVPFPSTNSTHRALPRSSPTSHYN
jgi:hypothetical protein